MYSLYNLKRKNDQREFLDPDVSVDGFPPSDQRLVRSGGGWKFRRVANVQGELGFFFALFFFGGGGMASVKGNRSIHQTPNRGW